MDMARHQLSTGEFRFIIYIYIYIYIYTFYMPEGSTGCVNIVSVLVLVLLYFEVRLKIVKTFEISQDFAAGVFSVSRRALFQSKEYKA